jgi:hypothetical protein
MKIQLERGGGFVPAATRRSVTIDSDKLAPDAAARLRDLVAAAALPSLAAAARPISPPRPDAFHYRVVVEDGDQRYSLDAADPDLTPGLRSLVNWLMKH